MATAASGPFYCPGDKTVYIDLAFYQQLARQFGAPGDFAQAYVLSHEVGHHVQNIIGVLPQFNRMRQSMPKLEVNHLSVKVELQADCFAGVWGHYVAKEGWLEQGDLEEALVAANQIGDDTIQRNTQGYVVPDAFNHGTSEQRKYWFRRGFESGMHAQDCWSELGEHFPPPALTIWAGTWSIDNDWADEDLAGVTFEVGTILTGVHAPETGYETCVNLHHNDATPIPLTWPGKFLNILQLTLDEGDGSVVGPPYGVNYVTAAGDFESEMTSCNGSACSRAGMSSNELGDWAIDEMTLNVDGYLIFSNGTQTETVTNARLELYGPAIGAAVPGIPPASDGVYSTRGWRTFLGRGEGRW
jgi:hypothetical protein